MRTRNRRAVGAVVGAGMVAALIGAALVPAAGAATPSTPSAKIPRTAPAPQRAAGVLFELEGSAKVSAASVGLAAARDVVGVDVASVRPQDATQAGVVEFEQPVSAARAQEAADAVAALPGVAWAAPNLLLTIESNPPVNPTDPDFRAGRQFNIWDFKNSRPSPTGSGSVALPVGGYSTHAPVFWKKTKGKASTVVAVLDTGRTNHPQLDAHTVAGYDMISSKAVARDGNGRDVNPQDQGDWGYDLSGDLVPSSWHGTHVAGIVGALADGKTVVGNAPGVRIQHVRVLGAGGGSLADIAAGITWASGGTVSGVPKNKTKAAVINLSLGGAGRCSEFPNLQKAINGARARGSVVVVAAGNDNENAGNYVPASCNGVITVASLDQYGQRASYSNFGAVVDIATPGGEDPYYGPYLLVKSTVNTGLKTPKAAGYGLMMGTSQATPGVAGAAALLASTGLKGVALEKKLLASVRGFPTYSFYPGNNCTKALCGEGVLDLGKA
ncbi:S8 family serine peptidase [Cellulomonas sp. DKR-3]|uniref:S8 family serine peptidase n=1 Tax=Cellulomonas fulva TaxID=2835530 RepID=A0ABS5U1B3_9CELL|nr:S8 family serine peptidase [Cellulomonas fulva]MBT0995183.1 S8 family serine peptidase [Cellulomonas fulva]